MKISNYLLYLFIVLLASSCATHTETLTEVEPDLLKQYIFDHKDNDKDGVFNEKDYCPNTPKDVAVEKNGCPLDTDGDHVADYLDKCPQTVKGVRVDQKGCELDQDQDQVADSKDLCPNTPEGMLVDKQGCLLDDDQDLVANNLDKCPGTLKNLLVDQQGCALDLDKDLVINYNDLCPNTPLGVEVDGKGCPLDRDGDGYFDYLDACPDKGKEYQLDDSGCPIKKLKVTSFNMEVHFKSKSAEVIKPWFSKIKKVADYLRQHPNSTVLIEGHTDNQARTVNNMELSQQRAEAVEKILVERFHIAPIRITSRGFGATRPVADNNTAAGRAKNRRVVAIVTEQKEVLIKKDGTQEEL